MSEQSESLPQSSTAVDAATAPSTTCTMLRCNQCGQNNFKSRNKLFQHLTVCLVDRSASTFSSSSSLKQPGSIPDADYFRDHDAYIYVTGGRVRGKTLITAEKYSCREKKWELIANMAEHRGSHGSAVIDQYLYVMGGKLRIMCGRIYLTYSSNLTGGGLHSNLNSIERYDCVNHEWKILSSMPTFRHALCVLSVGRHIYAVGGWINGSIGSQDLERYDVDTDKWITLANMPTGRRLLGVTHYQNKLYAFGGNIDDKIWNSDVLEIYDIATDTWSTGKSIPIAGQVSAVTIGDYIYVVQHGHHILRYDPREDSYTQISFDLPLKKWFCFDVTVINDRMYFHGGNEDGVWSNAFWKYDVFQNTWEELPSMNRERRRCSAAVVVL